MAKHRLSKSTFIRSLQCQKSLYLHAKRPFLRDKISPEQLAKFRRGTDVGILARGLFPGGIDMSPKSPSALPAKRNETLALLGDNSVQVLYEAVLEFDEVLIMLDLLVRNGDGWDAYEVKSSRKLSQTYYNDAALQYYVLKGNNLNIKNFFLIYVNEQYVLQGELNLNELFIKVDVTGLLEQMLPKIAQDVAKAKNTFELKSSPDIMPGGHCYHPYPCDFIGHCWKSIPKLNLAQMRSLPSEELTRLFASKRFVLSDIQSNREIELIDPLEAEAFDKLTLTMPPEGALKILQYYQSKHKIAFVKLIYQQPAVPFLQGFRPYQAVPLLMCWQNTDINVQLFEANVEGASHAQKLLDDLARKSDLLITDDLTHISDFLPIQINFQAIGIRQLVAETPLYHPEFGVDYPFTQIAKALTGMELTSDHYLEHDMLGATAAADRHYVISKVKQYLEAIKQVWEAIAEKAKKIYISL